MLSEDAFVMLWLNAYSVWEKECKQVCYSVCVKEERKPKAATEKPWAWLADRVAS